MVALQDPQFVIIEQRIKTGDDWNGLAPKLATVLLDPDFTTKGVKAFAEGDEGGLFEFDFTSFFLMEVQQINVDFAGVGSKSIVIRRASGPDVQIFASTDPLEVNILITDKFQLAVDEKIIILSSGAGAAMYARITARPLHPEPTSVLNS